MDFGQSCAGSCDCAGTCDCARQALALNPDKAGIANANIIFIDKELIKVFLIGNKLITEM
jgi:hypothetical protein